MEKVIVLDSNILIRAALGRNVRNLLNAYYENVDFFTTPACYVEVRRTLPTIIQKRNLDAEPIYDCFNTLDEVVIPLDEPTYINFAPEAKKRLQYRDPNDWFVLALALSLNCTIWTEDMDFCGVGVATWQTRTIEIYLRA